MAADDGKKNGKKNQKAGVPLFDEATRDRIAREALASNNMANVARQYKINDQTLYRYVKSFKERNPEAASDKAQVRPRPPERGRFARPGAAAYSVTPVSDELSRLRDENRELKEALAEAVLRQSRLERKTRE